MGTKEKGNEEKWVRINWSIFQKVFKAIFLITKKTKLKEL